VQRFMLLSRCFLSLLLLHVFGFCCFGQITQSLLQYLNCEIFDDGVDFERALALRRLPYCAGASTRIAQGALEYN